MSEQERNEQTMAGQAGAESAGPAVRPRKRGWVRAVLLLLGPVAVFVVGSYVYMNTGRYVETDNAYIKATMAIISAEIAGQITAVAVRENQHVHKGDVLFEIDDDPYRVGVERAESQLEAVASFINGLQASYQQGLEELALAHTNIAFAERELAREQSLAERGLGSEIDLDEARHELDIARQRVPIIEQGLAQLRAQLGGALSLDVESHAAYRTVRSMLDSARLDLERTVVRAPFSGAASRAPTVGTYVTQGVPVMSLVSDRDIWIDANFKETQLTHVEVGQSVGVRIDTYPEREWRGTVESISQATGAEFSVIPAQNASGNWVKVAQRIPVRIALEVAGDDPPLRAGMSAIVEIDTRFLRDPPRFLGFLQAFRLSGATPVAMRN